ncbi:MAG: hypothetical protein AB7N65_17385 [Vicinamibacterales bacterium]
MKRARPFLIAVGLIVLSGHLLRGQETSAPETSRYRLYALESTLDSIIAASGARATDARTLHQRPANIQELQWRTPYLGAGTTPADPVRDILFTFYNDALYQLVVSYDRTRTEGLTNRDVIDSLSATYGVPTLASANTRVSPPPGAFADRVVLARWENAASVLTLVRGAYAPEFQLILVSRDLSTRARAAIEQAIKLDAIDAPRREAEQREKEASDVRAARSRARETNKGAFRP